MRNHQDQDSRWPRRSLLRLHSHNTFYDVHVLLFLLNNILQCVDVRLDESDFGGRSIVGPLRSSNVSPGLPSELPCRFDENLRKARTFSIK